MHLVGKQIKGHEYFYLIEKGRRDGRVVTLRTIYVGDRQKLVELIRTSAAGVVPVAFAAQPAGAPLALASVAEDLKMAAAIDEVCPVREGATAIGRQLLIAAIHRVLAPRPENSLRRLREFYEGSVLSELWPMPATALDNRRVCETLAALTSRQVEQIECEVVSRLIEHEGLSLNALAFDCTNFDSYAAASTGSRLLRRGHSKSGRPLRVLGLGLLVTEDEGMPLLTFTYPGNENDVTAFGRFLKALDRRRAALELPGETTVAADGGTVSRQMLLRLDEGPRYYVLRLPPHHLVDLVRAKRTELPMLGGSLKGRVWGRKYLCRVYGVERSVVDGYSRRMHKRQLPGLQRDRDRARGALLEVQRLLDRQRQGLRRAKPLTLAAVRRRVVAALAREHMDKLFVVQITKGQGVPVLSFKEPHAAWQHLEDYVLGRSLLVSNRHDWAPEQIVLASRQQSYNERAFRDLKDPGGVSMVPLRHRRDPALRAHALIVVIGLILAKVLQRRVKRAGIAAPSLASVLAPLKQVQRSRVRYGPDAPPAVRAMANNLWVPSERTQRQEEILQALKLSARTELGTTLGEAFSRSTRGKTQILGA